MGLSGGPAGLEGVGRKCLKLDASCGFFLTGFGWSGFGWSGQEAVRLPGGPARLEGVGMNVLGGWGPPAASS